MRPESFLHLCVALAFAPLLNGVIAKTKAFFGGRRGPPLLQGYYDIFRLLRKGAVFSKVTSWHFRAGPMVGLVAVLAALSIVPLGGIRAPVSFPGDVIACAGLLALARFMTVLAALDTASSFEGMGASREVQFAALAEPALLLSLASLAAQTGEMSLSGIALHISPDLWSHATAPLALLTAALWVVLLAENARIPFDDPNTHLELTMIHEVMVLDHSGPDFAAISYGASLKMWLFSAILAAIAVPVRTGNAMVDSVAAVAGIFACAVLVGIMESSMARLRLSRVPQALFGASVLAILSFLLQAGHQ